MAHARTIRTIRLHLAGYAAALTLVAVLSWLGQGWGYLVLYGGVLVAFAVVAALGSAWRAHRRGADAARTLLERSARSFTRAQLTLAGAVLVTLTFARLSSGPIGPFPGGPFEEPGSGTLPRDGWRIDGDEIQLQIPGNPPYTITTHAFLIDGALHVGADFTFPFKSWVKIVQREPRVRVRVDGRVFERRAVRISDPAESRRILEEVSRQRGVDPDDWLTEVWFFRMDPPS